MKTETLVCSTLSAPEATVLMNRAPICDMWNHPLAISITRFKHKSLADFTLNNHVGCSHGCPACYVPEVSARKLRRFLARYAVVDPDCEWGRYQLLRPFRAKEFLASLKAAKYYPAEKLLHGGHRAVMVSTTTDAFAPVCHPDRTRQAELLAYRDATLTQALELIRDRSDLNVRVLTRSNYAMRPGFVELFRSFGQRLMFGTSLPCLNHELVRAYEPRATPPRARLEMLAQARAAGLATFVAVAPVYPDVTDDELREVMTAVGDAGGMTIFLEPLHVRAGNIERIRAGFAGTGITPKLDAFKSAGETVLYAMRVLKGAERIAIETGVADRLHLWPDQELLESAAARKVIPDWDAHTAWLHRCWGRISEWPGSSPAEVAT